MLTWYTWRRFVVVKIRISKIREMRSYLTFGFLEFNVVTEKYGHFFPWYSCSDLSQIAWKLKTWDYISYSGLLQISRQKKLRKTFFPSGIRADHKDLPKLQLIWISTFLVRNWTVPWKYSSKKTSTYKP